MASGPPKAYLLSLSEAVSFELRATGVSVTTLCPGLTATDFHEVAAHPKPKWMRSITMAPDEVARIGVRGLLRGKAVVTPGFVNWLSAQMVGFVSLGVGVRLAALGMRGRG